MKIFVTARWIMDNGYWEKFCEVAGYSVWAVNEGMDDTELLPLTEEQAIEIGILPRKE